MSSSLGAAGGAGAGGGCSGGGGGGGDDIRNFSTRRRNLLFLMQRYLLDNGYYGAAESLKAEARLNDGYELCDNVDLDAMYLEYANYYNLKFGKYPKFLKRSTTATTTTTTTAGGGAGTKVGGAGGTNEIQHITKRNKQQQQILTATQQHGQPLINVIGAPPPGQSSTSSLSSSPGPGQLQLSIKKLDMDLLNNLQQKDQKRQQQQHQQQQQKLSPLAEIEYNHRHHQHHHHHQEINDNMLFNGNGDWQMICDLIKSTIIMHGDPKLSWNEICGNQQAIELIKEAVITPIQFPQLFIHGLKPWRSILLHGPPGSGKTLLAKVLCAETTTIKDRQQQQQQQQQQQHQIVTFFNITSSILVSKWRGESEKILRVLFHMAEKRAPSVIFLDEIEGLTSKRDRSTDHESSKRFKNELLQLLDGMEQQLNGVFILASTNLPWEIDDAFLRRFEKKILVQLPGPMERAKLIGRLLALSGVSLMAAQLERLVELSEQFTGDEIRLACKEIAMQNVRRVTRAVACGKQQNQHQITLNTTTIGGGGEAGVGGRNSNNNNNNNISNTMSALERVFQQIKPISVKLLKRHEEWQQEHGT